jgi:hypothetical protein
VERPLDERAWDAFARLQERAPGGFRIAALMRPPHDGEDGALWLERARAAAARGPLGHHTHWTSPTHARPSGEGDPAQRVREEGAWLREHGLAPTLFCGGGWYEDDGVRAAVAELGYADCTPRGREPFVAGAYRALPTTHSLGAAARGVLGRLPPYVHAYCHDYDLLDRTRLSALLAALAVLGRRRRATDLDALAEQLRATDDSGAG